MVVVSCRVANRVKDPIRGILGDPELFFQFIQVKSRYEAVAESKWDTRSRQLVNAVEVDKLGFFATRGELAALIGWPNQAPFQHSSRCPTSKTSPGGLDIARRSTLQMFEKST
ncbi:hypothetical protein E4U25_002968 [Claviceps purpurea]|nr:hypothetical protein E4U37_000806 [Claviceps purpurea]KAG6176684.1 hypothetical protein E4U27_004924 [Claviceps purpurea]KAG6237172.1 hypothetical protein E4U25_002968 [Claviceps purpurea]